MVTVYLVEPHLAVRQALTEWLEQSEELRLVGCSADIDTARREIERQQPEVVLLEIKRANGQGLQLISSLKAQPARPRILVLTSYAADWERDAVLLAGADAYVLKDIDTHQLMQLILSR